MNIQRNSKDGSARSVIIIGGGIGGLFSAWKLLKKGYNVTVLERQNSLGGLSTSILYNEYKMDIGPHFVTFPKKSELTEEIKELMNDNIISIPNIHQAYRIFFRNLVLDKYPTLYETIFSKGLNSFIHSLFSFFVSKIKHLMNNSDFTSAEEYLIFNYGNYLYKTWFKPYLDFTYRTNDIPFESIKEKFPLLRFKEVLQKTSKRIKKEDLSNHSPSVNYWYFKYGMGTLPNTLSEKIKSLGGKIILGTDVKNIEHDKVPKEILIVKDDIEDILKADIILYATPPNVTKKWFKKYQELDFTPSLSAQSIMVFLFINTPKVVNWWVITNYDTNLPFFRISHQNFLSDHVCPSGKSLLCVEISSKEDKELWNLDDSKLIKKIKEGLNKMQIFDVNKIEDYKIFKFKNLYHGVESNRNVMTKKIFNIINSLKNEFMVGVEIDAGTLVTQRLEEESSGKSAISLGGVYMSLEKSDAVVKKITSWGK